MKLRAERIYVFSEVQEAPGLPVLPHQTHSLILSVEIKYEYSKQGHVPNTNEHLQGTNCKRRPSSNEVGPSKFSFIQITLYKTHDQAV